ncbi:P-loop containing nucleoside triphosphate hydrolase protein [Apodospora peruviana]|uniref:P-loop containing nucleoside triphosphate hydrolase protein n=1 Tax=Apodospora peruviana TaxID=516989 RepID=A0AAE0M745_9PEZI|nr:P-loop containing nucleoside triphosphate hydrolase protein [Apodospora peruviana]
MPEGMEQFLIENTKRYVSLVKAFKPSDPKKGTTGSNETTSVSGDITVCARIRPLLEDEIAQGFPAGVIPRGNTSTVDVHELRRPVRGLPTINSKDYTVDKVFGPDTSTAQIYDTVLQHLVPWAWSGGVGTMFAYGQTGSGKTYTVSGLERHVAESLMDGSLEGGRKIHTCIVELAGQTAYDLLNSRKQISILEDSFGNTQLAGAVEHHVTNKDSMLELIDTAATLRRTEATKKNDTSSRSHAICRIRIENPAVPTADDGLLFLVDLAGSEAARDKDLHTASRMKEAREINTSLSVLKDCIRGRSLLDNADSVAGGTGGKATTKKTYIPFRQSALTKTLKHVFDPASSRSCKTVVVACVNPCAADVGPSKNTLRFAELLRVAVPQTGPVKYDPAVPSSWDNAQLRGWIDKNSGIPPISSATLAPFETGAQLLRLPVPEFLSRCLKTVGISPEQAQAFQSKFWRLHFDSSHRTTATNTTAASKQSKSTTGAGSSEMTAEQKIMSRVERMDSSEDIEDDPPAASIPFKDRIRPGMVVRCTKTGRGYSTVGQATSEVGGYLFVVLCPAWAVGERVRDIQGQQVNKPPPADSNNENETQGKGRFLCAMVSPGVMQGSYTVGLWRQVVVDVEDMDAEVLMEYDVATRYYYMTV